MAKISVSSPRADRAATAASSWVIYVPALSLSGSSSAHGHLMNSWARYLIGCQAGLVDCIVCLFIGALFLHE